MIRVDIEQQDDDDDNTWGYANQDGGVETVSFSGGCFINIRYPPARDEFQVYVEDVDKLIKALQECKKFVDSMK